MARRASSPHEPCPEALFRYRLVSQMKASILRGQKRVDVVRALAAQDHSDLRGNLRRVSQRTLQRWLKCYLEQGFEALRPRSRQRIDSSVVLPPKLIAFVVEQKQPQHDEQASIPELLRRARELGVIGPEQRIDRSTVYRACKRLGLYVGRRKRQCAERDTRRFAYPHRMQMVLCDGKHFRAGATRARRVALFFLDDASRFGLHGVVGTAECAELFVRGLYETCRRYGIAVIYYLDRGPGFIADDSFDVVRKLDSHLIHGQSAYPQGHGKIERFNQTAKRDVLRGYDGRADIDPDPRALELRLQHYLREVYNHRPHESLGGMSPSERFHSDTRPLRFADSDDDLRQRFVLHIERKVSNDHVISFDSVHYEVPRGHACHKVIVHRRLLDGTIAILHEGKLVELHPVDLAANARARRAKPGRQAEPSQHPLPKSAADLAFERDFRPVVDADGGFIQPPTEKKP